MEGALHCEFALHSGALLVQAAFRDSGVVPGLQGLLQLGPEHPTAGAAAKALLVLLYDFHRAPAWLWTEPATATQCAGDCKLQNMGNAKQ